MANVYYYLYGKFVLLFVWRFCITIYMAIVYYYLYGHIVSL